jgi:hypothetical protein
MASIQVFLADGRQSWPKTPKKHLGVTETSTKIRRRISELEKLLGQAHAKIELLKKPENLILDFEEVLNFYLFLIRELPHGWQWL